MRRFPGLRPGHWLVGQQCPICEHTFKPGDETTLIVDEPASPEDLAKREAGRSYTATAVPVHWTCVPEKYRAAQKESEP